MSDWKKSVVPTVGVLTLIVGFVLGENARRSLDLGSTSKVARRLEIAGIENPTESPRNVSESELFYQLMLLLEREYVDPNIDEAKLAVGSVKGMIAGLWDPLSQYYAADHWTEAQSRMRGVFSGIGVEIRSVVPQDALSKVRKSPRDVDPLMLLPELVVATVLPGSPAESAGLAVGDRIDSVNGKWIMGFGDVKRLREMQDAVTKGQASPNDLKKVRASIQAKIHSTITAGRATEILTQGEGKEVTLTWLHGGARREARVTTAKLQLQPVAETKEGFALRLFSGAAQALSARGLPSGNLTIDLRQSTLGDSREIKPLLSLLAPAGSFGKLKSDRPGEPRTLATDQGAQTTRHYALVVDRSTRGAAEVLALALKARGLATLSGPTAGEPYWIEADGLPDGSGYTLATGRFTPSDAEAKQ